MAELSIVWTSVAIGGMVAVPLSILIALWSDLSHKREPATRMALRESERASDENAATDVVWNGDKAYYTDVPIEEAERQIREALNLRRLERSSKNDVLNVV